MSRLFVSYAREDVAFVRRLHDAITADGFSPWVDWDGIPPADDWLRKIHLAIEAADALVFVISPDSLSSPVCHAEVAHAVRHHKRLLPVVWREPGDALHGPHAHEAVGKINWIFFNRPQDDFTQAVRTLCEAARTDLAWVEGHTRLLVRSLEWKQHQRDASFLLVKTDLAAAEDWLARAPDRKPRPTQDHSDYIVASRQAAMARQRRRTVLASAAAVLIGMGALLATWQYGVAELRRQDSQSRQLAALAPTVLDSDPRAGLLLAAQAVSVSATPEAVHTLASVLERARGVQAFLPGSYLWGTLDATRDGQRVAAVRCLQGDGIDCRQARLEVWGTAPVAHLHSMPLPPRVGQVAFSRDGQEIAVQVCCQDNSGSPVAEDATQAHWTVRRYRLPPARADAAAGAAAVSLAPVETRVLPSSDDLATDLSELLWKADAPPALATGLQLRQAVQGDRPVLSLIDGAPGNRPLAQLALQPGRLHDPQLRQDSRLAAAWACQPMASGPLCQDVQLALLDASETPAVTARFSAPWPDWIRALALLPGVPVALSGGCAYHDYTRCRGGELRLWMARDGDSLVDQPAPLPLLGGGVQSMRLAQDGRVLAVLSEEGVVALFRQEPARLAATRRFTSLLEQPVATGGTAGRRAPRLKCPGDPVPAALAFVAASLQDPKSLCVALAEVAQSGPGERSDLDPQIVVAVTAAGDRLAIGGCLNVRQADAVCTQGRVRVLRVQAGLLVPVAGLELPDAPLALALSEDGAVLAMAACGEFHTRSCSQGRLLGWSPADPGQAPRTLLAAIDGPTALALTADGARVALASCRRYADTGGILRPCARALMQVASSRDGAQLQRFDSHAAYVDALAFRSDGRVLASGSRDGAVGLWDVARGEAVVPVLYGPNAPVVAVRFQDGQTLLSVADGGGDVSETGWSLGSAAAQATACRVAQGPLAAAERRRYVGDEDVSDPCVAQASAWSHRLWAWLRPRMNP